MWPTAEKELKEALAKAGLPGDYDIVVVGNDEEAKKHRFFGSPQITVDGKDIDTVAKKASRFQAEGCRLYMWQGKMYEYPLKEMILTALRKVKSS